MYLLHSDLKMSAAAGFCSLLRDSAKMAVTMPLKSLAALISACQKAGRDAGSLGRNLPDFSAQYNSTATDCEMVTGFPPGPSESTITGICPFGFIARNEGDFCSPFVRSMGWKVYARPHSSRPMRARMPLEVPAA